ncbi:putative mitochondrial inner membrane magnesium transporter MRS2 precursor [Triangularia setosa]|uniref:Magnesium transporter n=1 Tax=Triangularia setosa TaxID=2587417 RepID=A0AAN6WGX4_9PEZI|nr:putative mitochondrial inner membrane magnesium transporter MRS2 precursor [Podospora setosa]
MPLALRPAAAPSRSLLRYLHAQSEGLCYAEYRSIGVRRTLSTTTSTRRNACTDSTTKSRETQQQSVTGKGIATPHQAGLLPPLDLLIPKSLRKQSAKSPTGTTTPRYYASSSSQKPPSDKVGEDGEEGCKRSWQDWLFGSAPKKARQPLKDDDLPVQLEEESGSIFQRRALTSKAALDPRLRCTEVDGNGDVIMVDGELKKSELIAKYGLLPRDLRKIDSSNLPHILVRPSAILLNLLHLKVLIKHDRVLLFDVYGSKSSYPQSAFMYDLQGKLQQKQAAGANSLPYEFRALEAVLMSVTSELEADFESVRDPVIRVLSELEDDIDREKLRILLVLSKRVSTFEQKAKLVRDAIEELLEADDDLAAMYLTEKTHDLFRGEDDHTEVELLLESYNKICDEVVQEASNLVSSIRNTEEIIRAILDANRNSLMLLDLKFSVGTLGLAMGTFLAGLYGMNLENFIEETNWGFGAVTGVSSIASLFVCWYGLVKLRKIGRVKMNIHDVRRGGGQSHWYREDGTDVLLDPTNRERLRRMNMLKNAKQPKAKKWPF